MKTQKPIVRHMADRLLEDQEKFKLIDPDQLRRYALSYIEGSQVALALGPKFLTKHLRDKVQAFHLEVVHEGWDAVVRHSTPKL